MLDRVVEAVVQAGGRETAYVRAGAGRPVVLLLRAGDAAGAGDAAAPGDAPTGGDDAASVVAATGGDDAAGGSGAVCAGGAVGVTADPLFAALAREFRVVAPTLPDGPLLPERVRDVIDGLGLVRPALLVDAALAGSLAGVAFPGDDRCGCFVVLHPTLPSAGGPRAHGGGLQTPDSGWALPVAYRSRLDGVRLLELPLDDDGVGLSATSLAALIEFLRTDCCPP